MGSAAGVPGAGFVGVAPDDVALTGCALGRVSAFGGGARVVDAVLLLLESRLEPFFENRLRDEDSLPIFFFSSLSFSLSEFGKRSV
jgi:hypothetical protein